MGVRVTLNKVLKTSFLLFALILSSCSKVYITPVNYAWASESELPVSQERVIDKKNGLSFDLDQILKDEKIGTVSKVNLIRDRFGYYYLTAEGFKNVYILVSGANSFSLKNVIRISEESLVKPAFNQRNKYIQFVYGTDDKILNLNADGIVKEDK